MYALHVTNGWQHLKALQLLVIDCSMLGRIVRVTDEVVEYRDWIRNTFPISTPCSSPTLPSTPHTVAAVDVDEKEASEKLVAATFRPLAKSYANVVTTNNSFSRDAAARVHHNGFVSRAPAIVVI